MAYENIRKEDCYFYWEEPDMGGHIPTCNYYMKLGYCPCDGCKKYLSTKEVSKIVRNHIERERDEHDKH